MRPFFFGASERQLFGVYYEPQAQPLGHGVVLCPPMGHEYVNALRGYRQLAVQLARAGFHVLRFDYSGSGDSAGEGEDANPSQWVADIETAIGELRGGHRLPLVSLGGLRLGGTLATVVACHRSDVRRLVLWEPVVSGLEHVAELQERHQAFLLSESAEGRNAARYTGSSEIMGFPLSDAMRAGLEGIDLRGVSRPPAQQVLVIGDGEHELPLVARLRALCGQVDHRSIPGHKIWIREVGAQRALVPQPVLDAIIGWLVVAETS